ncbi:MAG: glycosyltransferase, partial [Dictyoglomus sp.]
VGGILDKKAKEIFNEKLIFIKSLVREISPIKDLITLLKLIKLLKKEEPDIIHTHSSKAGIIGRVAGFLAGVRVIIHTYHGFGFHDYQKPWVKRFYLFLERIASNLADALIFVSKANIETAKRYSIGDPQRYHLIRSGIKLSGFSKEKNKSFAKRFFNDVSANSKVIITVANLKPQKNPGDFFEIAKTIISEFDDVFFIYCGGGESEENERYWQSFIFKKGI